jgi:hypothetical protein
MKLSRCLATAFALALLGTWAAGASACDQAKTKSASAGGGVTAVTADMKGGQAGSCTADMAAKCTADMAKACPYMSGKSAGKGGSCPMHGHAATAVVASSGSCSAHKGAATAVVASSGSCSAHKGAATAVVASSGSCSAHRGAATAVVASSGSCSARKGAATAVVAGADGHCGTSGKASAMAAGTGHCGGKGMTAAGGGSAHADCDACADLAVCDDELRTAGAQTQVVPLKNGVMFVYTAEKPGQVRAVQAAVARRGDRITQFVAAGDKAHLCPDCKSMRGAMASGKLVREVVNIEGGSLTLMTSEDPAVVAKIHAMVDVKSSRYKS